MTNSQKTRRTPGVRAGSARKPIRSVGLDPRHWRRAPRRTVLITDKDLACLEWLCRHRWASPAQLGYRFGLAMSNARRRCYRLRDTGLAVPLPTIVGCQSVWVPTRAGYQLVGYDGWGEPSFVERTFQHGSIVTDVVAALERVARRLVLTEAELRAAVRFDEPTREVAIARQITGLATGELFIPRYAITDERHYPDFVLVFDPQRRGASVRQRSIAGEIELTAKKNRELRAVLDSYVSLIRHGGLGAVMYYAGTPAIANQVQRATDRFPDLTPQRFGIRLLNPAEHAVPIPRREPITRQRTKIHAPRPRKP